MAGPPPPPQVYRATLRSTGEVVAVKVQRPGIEPIIERDLFLFRGVARLVNPWSLRRLGCNAQARPLSPPPRRGGE